MQTNRQLVSDLVKETFYQTPKWMFTEPYRTGLNSDAKLLYCLIKDRHSLSVKNKWINKKGEIYLIMSREQMQYNLGISKNTAKKAMECLQKFRLIEEERQGANRPNLIYLLTPEIQGVEAQDLSLLYGSSGFEPPKSVEAQDLSPSKTETRDKKNNIEVRPNRGVTCGQPPLIPKQSKSTKTSCYKTCLGMINVFTQNDTLRKTLQDYLGMRIKTGLSEGQFKVLLDELDEFTDGDEDAMIERTRASFAAGYRNIAFLDAKKRQRKGAHFDNIAHHGHSDSDGILATDDNGEVLVY